jgi:hypothetical protein
MMRNPDPRGLAQARRVDRGPANRGRANRGAEQTRGCQSHLRHRVGGMAGRTAAREISPHRGGGSTGEAEIGPRRDGGEGEILNARSGEIA